MKIKNLVYLLAVCLLILACKKDKDDAEDNFDAAGQALIDDQVLVEYLKTHYLNAGNNAIEMILDGETALMDRVITQTVVRNEISYKLYVLNDSFPGVTFAPATVDSVLVTYSGMTLDEVVFDSRDSRTWISLIDVIPGWSFGFTNFKGGNVVVRADESFYYEDFGKGFLFIPSGLAYRNFAQGVIPENSPLIFEITLRDVNKSDHDNDGVLNVYEDIDGDGAVNNDDSDGDGIFDYLDIDDDNDGVFTRDEDTNDDGDPRNDDTDNDGIPNYLDPDS